MWNGSIGLEIDSIYHIRAWNYLNVDKYEKHKFRMLKFTFIGVNFHSFTLEMNQFILLRLRKIKQMIIIGVFKAMEASVLRKKLDMELIAESSLAMTRYQI